MGAATIYTYDDNPPYRPSLDNLGGDAFENDPVEPPDPVTMPNADEHNERSRNQAGLNRVTPIALIYVTFPSGPVISNIIAMRSSILAGNITVVANAAGDTSLTWPSTLLPASAFPPLVTLAADVEIDRARAFLISGGVRVKTKLGSSGTNCDFMLAIF